MATEKLGDAYSYRESNSTSGFRIDPQHDTIAERMVMLGIIANLLHLLGGQAIVNPSPFVMDRLMVPKIEFLDMPDGVHKMLRLVNDEEFGVMYMGLEADK